MKKRCNKCDQKKPLKEFHRVKNAIDGRTTVCAKCTSETRAAKEAKKRAERERYNGNIV